MKTLASLLILATAAFAEDPGILKTEFIYETAPFPECHASTIVEMKGGLGLVAAWFGGTTEKNRDVGIWLSRFEAAKTEVLPITPKSPVEKEAKPGPADQELAEAIKNTVAIVYRAGAGKWTAPVEVANGNQPDGSRLPCWNPVLFQPKTGPLMLFYKVGPEPKAWWGMLRTSEDNGATWSEARRLPDGIIGPVKNKPIQLEDGTILAGTSTEHDGWRVHFERSSDGGKTWTATAPVNEGKKLGAIQPSFLVHPGGKLQAIGRTRGAGKVFEIWSEDSGKTWGAMSLLPLPNPNSGTDALTLRDGRHLLVYNPVRVGRSPICVAISKDGKTWQAAAILDQQLGEEFSYPACIQTADGLVHITYTWKRVKVKHVVLDPTKLVLRDMPNGEWPK